MPAIWVDTGELWTMLRIATDFNAYSPVFGLFVNDIEIALDTVIDDLTAATFPGAGEVPATSWATAILNDDGHAQIEHPLVQWIKSAGEPDDETVYGWYLRLTTGGGELLVAERFETPVLMEDVGDFVIIHPVLTSQSKNEPA